jgi:hypothetical protein
MGFSAGSVEESLLKPVGNSLGASKKFNPKLIAAKINKKAAPLRGRLYTF